MARGKYMGLREYARYRSIHHSTVQAAVTAGRCPASKDKAGKVRIDWKEADKVWAENTDPSKKNHKKGVAAGEQAGDDPGEAMGMGGGAYTRARAVRETFQAKLAALNYNAKSGAFVELKKVTDEWFRMGRTMRDALFNLPDRCSAKIAALTGIPDFRINAILRDEIRLILEELINAERRNGLESDRDDAGN